MRSIFFVLVEPVLTSHRQRDSSSSSSDDGAMRHHCKEKKREKKTKEGIHCERESRPVPLTAFFFF